MQVRLLGPVDVTVDGQARAISGLRRTALAAALALRAGDVVSADLLTELIWDSRPPPGAGQTLQSHVSQLRRFLGEAAVIRLVPPGYVLDLPGDGTDVGVAQRLIREGTTASDAAEGARVLREAIGLWHGRFLEDIDKFDPLFFHISPRAAAIMDPQARLFLEIAYATIEDAGYTPASLTPHHKVGVFVGVMNSTYTRYTNF